jgi:hypothetical protein
MQHSDASRQCSTAMQHHLARLMYGALSEPLIALQYNTLRIEPPSGTGCWTRSCPQIAGRALLANSLRYCQCRTYCCTECKLYCQAVVQLAAVSSRFCCCCCCPSCLHRRTPCCVAPPPALLLLLLLTAVCCPSPTAGSWHCHPHLAAPPGSLHRCCCCCSLLCVVPHPLQVAGTATHNWQPHNFWFFVWVQLLHLLKVDGGGVRRGGVLEG